MPFPYNSETGVQEPPPNGLDREARKTMEKETKAEAFAAQGELDLEPVSMYQLFARMFVHLARTTCERFGEEGEAAVREAVKSFGEERGRDIRRRAAANGHPNTPEHYLRSYDMGRSGEFESEAAYGENQVEQLFTGCVFAREFQAMGAEQYGLMYCQEIDPAIAHGYNENMDCIHDRHMFKDKQCTFCFRLKHKEE